MHACLCAHSTHIRWAQLPESCTWLVIPSLLMHVRGFVVVCTHSWGWVLLGGQPGAFTRHANTPRTSYACSTLHIQYSPLPIPPERHHQQLVCAVRAQRHPCGNTSCNQHMQYTPKNCVPPRADPAQLAQAQPSCQKRGSMQNLPLPPPPAQLTQLTSKPSCQSPMTEG
jgi:hypothetical protein